MSGILVDLKTTGKEKSPFKDCATESVIMIYISLVFIRFHKLPLIIWVGVFI